MNIFYHNSFTYDSDVERTFLIHVTEIYEFDNTTSQGHHIDILPKVRVDKESHVSAYVIIIVDIFKILGSWGKTKHYFFRNTKKKINNQTNILFVLSEQMISFLYFPFPHQTQTMTDPRLF